MNNFVDSKSALGLLSFPSMNELSKAAAILGRKGGQIGGKARTKAKIAAVRRNGKKGGRPKKIA